MVNLTSVTFCPWLSPSPLEGGKSINSPSVTTVHWCSQRKLWMYFVEAKLIFMSKTNYYLLQDDAMEGRA